MKQLSLFEDEHHRRLASRQEPMVMDAETLVRWKSRIFEYQHSVRNSKPPQQQMLFSLPRVTEFSADEIDPFSLKLHSALFYRMLEAPEPMDNTNQGCLYFIIDHAVPLLLYIGETKLSAQKRWKGIHDCKDYILSYIEMHRKHGLEVAVCATFWHHIPPQKKILKEWERELIYKWRSPFNRESWPVWGGQPFGKS